MWQNRLGHLATKVVKTILSHYNVPCGNESDPHFCSAYCLGKIQRLPFPSSQHECSTPLYLVHTDFWDLPPPQAPMDIVITFTLLMTIQSSPGYIC